MCIRDRYYSSPAYSTKTANYTIRAVELGRSEMERILYEGNKESGSIENLLCYGDYLYFLEDYVEGEESRDVYKRQIKGYVYAGRPGGINPTIQFFLAVGQKNRYNSRKKGVCPSLQRGTLEKCI